MGYSNEGVSLRAQEVESWTLPLPGWDGGGKEGAVPGSALKLSQQEPQAEEVGSKSDLGSA